MRAPEPLRGIRVVASPGVLDALVWSQDATALRLAADDLFVMGAAPGQVQQEQALVEDEAGFAGWWLTSEELTSVIDQVEWPLPAARPALAQGLIAGVPAKLWLGPDRSLLLCAAAYAHELQARLP